LVKCKQEGEALEIASNGNPHFIKQGEKPLGGLPGDEKKRGLCTRARRESNPIRHAARSGKYRRYPGDGAGHRFAESEKGFGKPFAGKQRSFTDKEKVLKKKKKNGSKFSENAEIH